MTAGEWGRVAFGVLYAGVLVAGVGLGLKIMVDGYSPVPFADLWAQFPFIERSLQGDIGIGDLWAQWNEHRILLARVQFLLDYGLFDGTNVFLFASIAASSLLLAAVFATAVWLDTRDWLVAFGTTTVAATATMSPAGIENLNWSFQVAFVQVFLFAAAAILAIVVSARSASASRRAIAAAGAAILAIAATYSLANGLIVWFVVVGLAVVLKLPRRLTGGLALAGAAAVCSFLWRFESSTGGSLSDPIGLVRFVALYLGSAVWGAGSTQATLVGAVGLVLFGVLAVVAWQDRAGTLIALPFGAGVATFILLTAAQTAVGRLELGTAQALSSRYSIGSFTFWLALLVGFLVPLRQRVRTPLAAPAALAGAALVALFVGVRTLPVDSFLPTVVLGRELTVVAFRVGIDDVSQTVFGVQGGLGVPRALRWMEQEELGPWAPGGMVEGQRVESSGAWASLPCLGAIDAKVAVPGGSQLRGWIAAPDSEPSSRNLVVIDGDDRRSGLGLVGTFRPDVARWNPDGSEVSGFVAYMRREPDSPLEVVLLSPDGERPVCSLDEPG